MELGSQSIGADAFSEIVTGLFQRFPSFWSRPILGHSRSTRPRNPRLEGGPKWRRRAAAIAGRLRSCPRGMWAIIRSQAQPRPLWRHQSKDLGVPLAGLSESSRPIGRRGWGGSERFILSCSTRPLARLFIPDLVLSARCAEQGRDVLRGARGRGVAWAAGEARSFSVSSLTVTVVVKLRVRIL